MVAGKSCTGIGTGPQDGDDVDVHRHSIGMRPVKNFWPEREHLDHGEDAVNMYYCSSMSRQCPMNVCTENTWTGPWRGRGEYVLL